MDVENWKKKIGFIYHVYKHSSRAISDIAMNFKFIQTVCSRNQKSGRWVLLTLTMIGDWNVGQCFRCAA
jgi:hypothetical protein